MTRPVAKRDEHVEAFAGDPPSSVISMAHKVLEITDLDKVVKIEDGASVAHRRALPRTRQP